tara:strand:- start:1930 stop:2439 length:510 start_codon:yes stop_codon:yes gene_type:complete
MSHHNRLKFEKAPELKQKVKDSLHTEANKYGKAFWSPKYKVNVDPEDGVLSNRPVYSDGTKLTYESIDKPYSKSSNQFAAPFMAKSPLKDNGGIKKPSIVEDNPGENPTFTPGTPWSQYSDEEVKANAGSGKPLPKQYYQGKKVNPNINDAWQTNEQAQATEDLENTNN